MNTKNTLIAILTCLLLSTAAMAQVGIGTTTPHASAALDVESTTKGFLPPRMTTVQRNAIASPADGLTIFNTTENCLQWYNGTGWYDGCDGSTFVAPVTGIPGNTTCSAASISVTPCSVVPGATLNDDANTADGTEYDWTNAASSMSGGTTQALVEIGGQCWFRRNATAAPTTPCADAINTGCNVWGASSSLDIGSWGYYNTATTSGASGWATSENAVGEGLLYQWSAAMNGSTTERAQGVCPTGWHVPSDCEWMYLENTLGMSTTDQQGNATYRISGNVGTKLKSGSGGSSGFTALLAGIRSNSGAFSGALGNWWSSSQASTDAQRRLLNSSAGVYRSSSLKAYGYSVRCLKD